MDQDLASEALNPSAPISPKKLNAKAPEFVPRTSGSSAAAPPPPPPLLRPMYVRPPPPFAPPFFAYENFYQPNVAPFYGYNVNPVGPVDVKNGATTTHTPKNGVPDAHQKIINQVEFYFSDINLATTDQLFKFMIRDPEGYVPLTVVGTFKKIKSSITDVAQLASILRGSNKLIVSEDGEKVKRKLPLTESDMEELQSRIVIAENLPKDHSHQNLMKIFSSVGSVKSIRTCPPQNQICSSKGDGMPSRDKFHAFVEYGYADVAEKAVTELKDGASWRNSLKVRLLLKSTIKSTHTHTKIVGHEGQSSGKRDEAAVSEMQGFKENQSEDSPRQSDAKIQERRLDDNAKGNVHKKGRNGNNKGRGRGQGQGRGRPHHHPTNGGSVMGSAPLEISTDKLNLAKAAASPVPRMPDGTKGFSVGRGKSVAV